METKMKIVYYDADAQVGMPEPEIGKSWRCVPQNHESENVVNDQIATTSLVQDFCPLLHVVVTQNSVYVPYLKELNW